MLEKVIEIISDHQGIDAATITADSRFITDLGLSSYDLVSLVSRFEDEFDIEVPDRQIKLLKTVGDAVKFIEERIEE